MNSQGQDGKIDNASDSERGGFYLLALNLDHLVNFSEPVTLAVKGEQQNPQ